MARTSGLNGVAEHLDVLIVGAGFAGMYMLYNLRKRGFRARVIEAGGDVGGTWYWNRYPGARCDVESHAYSYSFSKALEQEWHWPHRYAYQPDILRYAGACADRFDLRKDIHFNTFVESAVFDETQNCWTLTFADGTASEATFCVMATGCLSVPKIPDIEGINDFEGRTHHTANWPEEEVDLTGRRVGVFGTGSSGVQVIPIFAKQAKHLVVFQRTPNFSIPSWNKLLSEEEERAVKDRYEHLRQRARNSLSGEFAEENVLTLADADPKNAQCELWKRWSMGGFYFQCAFGDLLQNERANKIAAEFVRDRIREKVHDPVLAEILCPKTYPIAAKRLCVDDSYFETFNRDNVTLVDLKATPIERVKPDSVKTTVMEFPLDDIVLATGFDAITGALMRIDVRGRHGKSLQEKWKGGAKNYLGVSVAGFPNLFIITGPGSPSVLGNMIVAIEQHVEWISECLSYMHEHGHTRIEARQAAEEDWVAHVNEEAARTLYLKAASWFLGANVPGKVNVFLPYPAGFKPYSDICDKISANYYEGFQVV